jgi:hypothetical protein
VTHGPSSPSEKEIRPEAMEWAEPVAEYADDAAHDGGLLE